MSRDEAPKPEGEKPPEKPPEEPKAKPEPEVEPEAKKEPKPKTPEEKAGVGYASLRHFAKIFDVSKGTVIRWIKQGQIKGFRTYTGQWRIPRSEIEKVVNEFKTQPAPEKKTYLKPKTKKREETHEREGSRKEEKDDFL